MDAPGYALPGVDSVSWKEVFKQEGRPGVSIRLVSRVGLEPTTHSLKGCCSTN